MNIQNKWVMGGILVAILIVGCTLGAVAVTLFQRTMWGYPPAHATSFAYNRPMAPNAMPGQGAMPGTMFGQSPRWNGGPMMRPNNFMGRNPQGNFGPGMMGRGGYGSMMGAGPGWSGGSGSLIAIAAEKLDMTTAELSTELQAGKTIADLTKESDVSLDSIVDALLAPRLERMALMVANGRITQEQIDTTETMRTNLTVQLSNEWTFGGPGLGTCPGLGDTDGDGLCDHAGPGPGFGGRGMMWR
jgi:hypothetical protein